MEIEEYLKKNNALLDTKNGDYESIWNGLNQKKYQIVKRRRTFIPWMAASIILFITIGVLVRHEWIMHQQINSLSQLNKELAEREFHYQKQVNQKWEQYTLIQSKASPMEPLLIDELKRLDTLYQIGLAELNSSGLNERAVIILFDTYEKRLRIIEQMIYEKQKQASYENKSLRIDL